MKFDKLKIGNRPEITLCEIWEPVPRPVIPVI